MVENGFFLKINLIFIKITQLFQELLFKLKIDDAFLVMKYDICKYKFVESVQTSILKDRQVIVIPAGRWILAKKPIIS